MITGHLKFHHPMGVFFFAGCFPSFFPMAFLQSSVLFQSITGLSIWPEKSKPPNPGETHQYLDPGDRYSLWRIVSETVFRGQLPATVKKHRKNLKTSLKFHHLEKRYTSTSWWFQPLWKIFVKMGSSSPNRGEKKNVWNHHPDPLLGKEIIFQILCSISICVSHIFCTDRVPAS